MNRNRRRTRKGKGLGALLLLVFGAGCNERSLIDDPRINEPCGRACAHWFTCLKTELETGYASTFGEAGTCRVRSDDDIVACIDACEAAQLASPTSFDSCTRCLEEAACPGHGWERQCSNECQTWSPRSEHPLETFTCADVEDAPQCSEDETNVELVLQRTSTTSEPFWPRSFSYHGLGVVITSQPLTVLATDGSTISVAWNPSLRVPAMHAGESLELQVEASCPFGCFDQSVVARRDGSLLLAAWARSSLEPPVLPELELAYRRDACASGAWSCVSWVSNDLLADERVLKPGTTVSVSGLRVTHGQARSGFMVVCTDVPSTFASGLVAREE